MRTVGALLVAAIAGLLLWGERPADAQTAVQIFGTVTGTATTPVALRASADGALIVANTAVFNQSLNTTDDVTFASVTVTNGATATCAAGVDAITVTAGIVTAITCTP